MKKYKKYKRRKYFYIDCHLIYPLKQKPLRNRQRYTPKSAKSALSIKNLV